MRHNLHFNVFSPLANEFSSWACGSGREPSEGGGTGSFFFRLLFTRGDMALPLSSRHESFSFQQYLSAIKGVTGELLLETDCLSDNSRRDWFKVDKNSLQLRNQLCQLMNRMHTYRYKISRYMHNDMKTEAEKQSVIQAYRELVSQKNDGADMAAIEQYMNERFQKENANKIDVRADERDILGYTTTQKKFYKTLMMAIYVYFENKGITDYYALKSHILKSLNRDSIDSESESTTGDA